MVNRKRPKSGITVKGRTGSEKKETKFVPDLVNRGRIRYAMFQHAGFRFISKMVSPSLVRRVNHVLKNPHVRSELQLNSDLSPKRISVEFKIKNTSGPGEMYTNGGFYLTYTLGSTHIETGIHLPAYMYGELIHYGAMSRKYETRELKDLIARQTKGLKPEDIARTVGGLDIEDGIDLLIAGGGKGLKESHLVTPTNFGLVFEKCLDEVVTKTEQVLNSANPAQAFLSYARSLYKSKDTPSA